MLIDIVIFGETTYLNKILTKEAFSLVKKKLINKEVLGCIDVDAQPFINYITLKDVSHKVVITNFTKWGIKGELTIFKTERGSILEDIMKHTEVEFKPILNGGFNMWGDFYVKDIEGVHAYPVRPNIKTIRIKKLNSIFGIGNLK
jgi:hypothetical protein